MSKWINDRAWTVSMYICYALCFIILSVAGYNYTMSIIGETSSIMKVVLFICIILFVGFGVSMVFSIFITPLSELLSRLLWHKRATVLYRSRHEGRTTAKSKPGNPYITFME